MPLTPLQTLIVAAQRSGFFPKRSSHAAEELNGEFPALKNIQTQEMRCREHRPA
jgi:hypothetical protein